MKEEIKDLAAKARGTKLPHEAMQFAQAALNLAHTDAVLEATRRENAAAPPSRGASPATPIDIEHMVSQFLAWKLPKDFAPDAGISFNEGALWPSGTNLLHAGQARELIEHLLRPKM